jgi:hypothetical protein
LFNSLAFASNGDLVSTECDGNRQDEIVKRKNSEVDLRGGWEFGLPLPGENGIPEAGCGGFIGGRRQEASPFLVDLSNSSLRPTCPDALYTKMRVVWGRMVSLINTVQPGSGTAASTAIQGGVRC